LNSQVVANPCRIGHSGRAPSNFVAVNMLDMGGATKFGEGAELPISRSFRDHPL